MKFKKLGILMVILSVVMMGIVIAEDGTTAVTITNTAPSIDSIELNDGSTGDNAITLTAATTTTITCAGTASDADGATDITGVSGVIYSANSAEGSADDPADHYSDSDCGYNSGDGSYSCSFDVQFYGDAALWTCSATATDASSATGSDTDTATVGTLLALDIPDATNIDFGSLSVGQNIATPTVVYENEGNVVMDVTVDAWETAGTGDSSNSFTCTSGTQPIANFRASLTSGAYSSYTSMVATGSVTLDSNLAQQTTGSTPTSDTIYFGMEISSGASGSCTGVVSINAIAG